MTNPLLHPLLEPISRDERRARLWRDLSRCWLVAIAVGLVLLVGRGFTDSFSWRPFMLVLGAMCVAGAWTLYRWRGAGSDTTALVRKIESEHPDLHALLLTAAEQQPDPATGDYNYLQQRVIDEALEHHRRSPWGQSLRRQRRLNQRLQWAALACLVLVLVGLLPKPVPGSTRAWATRSNGISVAPGDTTLERGSGLVVLARFEGRLPAEATLVVRAVNHPEQRIPLAKNLDDPVFGAGLTEVANDLTYRVESSRGQTRDFKVTVFDYPRLEHANAKVTYPAYTGLAEKSIADIRRLSAVEGSTVEFDFHLNKPVTSARLAAKGQTAPGLTVDPNRPTVYRTRFALDQTRRFTLVLVDAAGRTNKLPPEFVIEAVKNRPPELKLSMPRGDQRVSPLEEITFRAETSDDFGLRAFGVAYTLTGQETQILKLGGPAPPQEKRQLNYLLPLERLGAHPDQLLSYYLWADDSGPDGQVRRTTSDMFFAEVRPFDEIFREGQSSGRNQQQQDSMSGQGSPTQKLAELQKQIISATWNLQRRETTSKPSDKYKSDVDVIHQSQQQGLDQLKEASQKTEDPRIKAAAELAKKSMEGAAGHLKDASAKN